MYFFKKNKRYSLLFPPTSFSFYPKIKLHFFSFFFSFLISPDNHGISDVKTCREVCAPSPQAERELNISQVNCQNKGYTAGMPHQNCRKYSLILETYFHCCLEEAKRKREKPRFTLGIFLLLFPFWGSPKEKKVSSGLLGVEGGLILDGDPVPSRLSFRMSGSLKLRRSEFCRKKMGLESNWKWKRRSE